MNGIRVGDGLAMRRPLFESLEEHEWEEVLRKLNKFYTNKENKSEMDKVQPPVPPLQYLALPRSASSSPCTGSWPSRATRRSWSR